MSMETCHANRAVASRGNGVLRYMKTMSSKERVDPGMVELRSILLLKGDLGGACGQCVRGELERNDSVLKEGASPLPIAESRFIVSGDAAAELPVFPLSGHLTIKKGKYAAADVVCLPVWMETKIYNVGLEVVLEIE